MMTIEQIQTLMLAVDAGIRAAGARIFADNGGAKLQSALDALQLMAQEAEKNGKADTDH